MLFGDAPANHTAHWEPGPDTRGSMSILSSCLVTLGLCIWTSVHLNIPERGEDKPHSWWDPRGWLRKQTWRKICWLLVGMFAPEFIAFTAYTQWRSARQLTKDMQALLDHQMQLAGSQSTGTEMADVEVGATEAHAPTRRHSWTLTHSFYALMGGFVFDFSHLPEDKQFLPDSATRSTIGPPALRALAKHHPPAVPDISSSYIQDKSNANGLAKAIVCVQATWFVTQCIVRLAARLPVSLLELNTWAHCICTLLTYAFWWTKPLDIEEASSVSDPTTYGFYAGIHVQVHEPAFILDTESHRKDGSLVSGHPVTMMGGQSFITTTGFGVLHDGQAVRGLRWRPRTPCCGIGHWPHIGVLGHKAMTKLYNDRDCRRWELASEHMKTFHDIHPPHRRGLPLSWMPKRMGNAPKIRSTFILELQDHSEYESTKSAVYSTINDPLLPPFLLAGAFYGGLHLLAWDAPFVSHSQSLLWRLSSLTVATAGLGFMIEAYMCHLYIVVDDAMPRNFLLESIDNIFAISIGLCFICSRLLYVFARVYLFVESLISFPYLPSSVYQEPRWSYYFPHIS